MGREVIEVQTSGRTARGGKVEYLGQLTTDTRSVDGDSHSCVDVSWWMHVMGGRLETDVSLDHVPAE